MYYIFQKSLRGKGKHCPILKNLAYSHSTHCDPSVQGCAQKTPKKGRTLTGYRPDCQRHQQQRWRPGLHLHLYFHGKEGEGASSIKENFTFTCGQINFDGKLLRDLDGNFEKVTYCGRMTFDFSSLFSGSLLNASVVVRPSARCQASILPITIPR